MMTVDLSVIEENYKRILFDVGEAAAKYRRPDEKIQIMAVTKTVPPENVNHAVKLGIKLLGENRVQEYMSKKDLYSKEAEVQFIGRLQTNKVKYIIDSVTLIQSADSQKLINEINRQALKHNKVQDILIEVNIGDEASKGGVDKAALDELIYSAAELENVKVRGLMAIPPAIDPERHLSAMGELFSEYSQKHIEGVSMDILSMGMSGDYAAAVKYGSNLVRIGRGLFGPRDYR